MISPVFDHSQYQYHIHTGRATAGTGTEVKHGNHQAYFMQKVIKDGMNWE